MDDKKTKPDANPTGESDDNQATLAGIGSNSEPQGIDPIDPEINDIAELNENEVISKYAEDKYKELNAMLDESAALKVKYPQRVITDADGRAKAEDLAKRARKLKNALKAVRDTAKRPHFDKYTQIQKAFTEAMEKPEIITKGWMAGVTDYDNREAAKEREIERQRLQKIEDARVEAENKRLAEEKRLRDENEELKRKLEEANAPKEETPAPADLLGDSSPTPPPPTPPAKPEPTPEPVKEVKAEIVPEVKVELAANQEEVWSVQSFDPERVDLNKVGVSFFGAGQVEAALLRYVKANKGNAVVNGVVFKSEIKTKLGR